MFFVNRTGEQEGTIKRQRLETAQVPPDTLEVHVDFGGAESGSLTLLDSNPHEAVLRIAGSLSSSDKAKYGDHKIGLYSLVMLADHPGWDTMLDGEARKTRKGKIGGNKVPCLPLSNSILVHSMPAVAGTAVPTAAGRVL